MMDISISSGFLLSLWWREFFFFGVCFGLVSWRAVWLAVNRENSSTPTLSVPSVRGKAPNLGSYYDGPSQLTKTGHFIQNPVHAIPKEDQPG
jgi:hypothetical protein